MAAVDFFSAFQYKWAQTGNVFAWDDAQYKLGWATIGSTPPSVEQFNRAQQVLDEKSNWLYGQLATVAAARGVTLSGASLTGLQQVLAAYGQTSTTDSTPGAWMQVGAFGLGGSIPSHTSWGFPNDFNSMDGRTGWVSVSGSVANGPLGAGATNYLGAVLELNYRGTTTAAGVVQEVTLYATGSSPSSFSRFGGGPIGSRTWSAWETVYTDRTIPAASTTVAGITQYATAAEAIAGTTTIRAVTPNALAAAVPAASTTAAGKIEIATGPETITGTDATRAVSPAGLTSALAAYVPAASTTVVGKTRLATTAEATTATLDTVAVTPAGLAAAVPQLAPHTMEVITATGSWVSPIAGWVDIELWGGGGGGGGIGSTGGIGGGGGGGGGYARVKVQVTLGQSVSCTIGAAGAAGGSGAAGGNGGATSFGAFAAAAGGIGGRPNDTGNGGASGSGTTGTLTASGGDGSASSTSAGGAGGGASFGGAGGGAGVGPSGPGSRPGGGGGGRGPGSVGSGAAGGVGLIIINY